MTNPTVHLVQAIDELAQVVGVLEVVEHYTTADWNDDGMRGCAHLLRQSRERIDRVRQSLYQVKDARPSSVEHDALVDQIDAAITHYVHGRHGEAFQVLADLIVRIDRFSHEPCGPELTEAVHE